MKKTQTYCDCCGNEMEPWTIETREVAERWVFVPTLRFKGAWREEAPPQPDICLACATNAIKAWVDKFHPQPTVPREATQAMTEAAHDKLHRQGYSFSVRWRYDKAIGHIVPDEPVKNTPAAMHGIFTVPDGALPRPDKGWTRCTNCQSPEHCRNAGWCQSLS